MRRGTSGHTGRAPFLAVLAALVLLVTGCASDAARPVDPDRDLYDPNPSRRTAAVAAAAERGDAHHVPRLVELLDDRDPAVRALAHRALERLTGHTAPFDAFAPLETRTAQAAAWRSWLAAGGEAGSGAAR